MITAASASPTPASTFPRYGVYLLLAVYTFCFLDRQIINILAEPIKHELGLSDGQLGLLTGLSFAIFYTALGLPIARLAERRNRAALIAVCLAVWSVFTVLCGFARGLGWLLVTRIGVGVGEAGCLPASHALISDYVPPSKRAWALAIFQVGSPLGILMGMALGGIVADAWGWRAAFILVGAPGLLLAIIVGLFLRDPMRRTSLSSPPVVSSQGRIWALASVKGYGELVLAASLATFVAYAQNAFIASFFLRAHANEIASAWGGGATGFIGTSLGLILGIGGVVGTLAGGWIGDRLARRGLRGYAVIASIACLLVGPLFVLVVFAPSLWTALAVLVPATLLNTLWPGPAFAAVQSLVEPRARATGAAVMLLFLTLFGLGLGPLCVGLVSDALAPTLGEAGGLKWALAMTSVMSLAAAAAFWHAGRRIGSLARDEDPSS